MLIALNKLQCRTFQRFSKKIEFQTFALAKDATSDTVTVRLVDTNGWQLTVALGEQGNVVNWNKERVYEDQPLQPQNS